MTVLSCSFCGKSQHDVHKLIAGPSVFICDECVVLGWRVIATHAPKDTQIPTPRELHEIFEPIVTCSTAAKRRLALAVSQHYRYWHWWKLQNHLPPSPRRLLLVGRNASEGERLARLIAARVHAPIAVADATKLFEYGYDGADGAAVVAALLDAADGDTARAKRGIIYLDNIDRVSTRAEFDDVAEPAVRLGMQDVLTQLLEGTEALVTDGRSTAYRYSPFGDLMLPVDTRGILLLCGGGFEGIEDIMAARVSAYPDAQADRAMDSLEPADLVAFGLSPFLARCFTVVLVLDHAKDADSR